MARLDHTREFLPVSREEMVRRGWDQADVILVTGDAYVDHSALGTAMMRPKKSGESG